MPKREQEPSGADPSKPPVVRYTRRTVGPDEVTQVPGVRRTPTAAELSGAGLVSRRLWERDARQLLTYVQTNRVEIHSAEAAELLGDLRAALEDVEIPEQYR